MPNLLWPSYAIPSSFDIKRYAKTIRSMSVFGRVGQNFDLVNDRWIVEVSISIRDAAIGAQIEAFVNYMRNGANTVEIYHFYRKKPLGSMLGTPVTNGVTPQGSDAISIQAVAAETLLAGDMIGINNQLFQVAFNCAANGSGIISVPIVGRVRESIPDDAIVVLQSPTARFRLSQEGSVTFGRGGHMEKTSLMFCEVIV
jgi:hypothetical protein